MIGVLLAGGLATRLPNKSLLPQRTGQPVCFSGLDYLVNHGVNNIQVVVPPGSILVDVISNLYVRSKNIDLNFIYQESADGVGAAINLAWEPRKEIMVVMADNIYPICDDLPVSPVNVVVLRSIPGWQISHLVRLGRDGLLKRSGWAEHALTTPWILRRHFIFCPGLAKPER